MDIEIPNLQVTFAPTNVSYSILIWKVYKKYTLMSLSVYNRRLNYTLTKISRKIVVCRLNYLSPQLIMCWIVTASNKKNHLSAQLTTSCMVTASITLIRIRGRWNTKNMITCRGNGDHWGKNIKKQKYKAQKVVLFNQI